MNQDELRKKVASDILSALDANRSCMANTEVARAWLEWAIKNKVAAMQRDEDRRVEYRTCVRSDDKTVHMQIRGPSDVVRRLAPMPEPDDTDEQLCDNWTKWEEVRCSRL